MILDSQTTKSKSIYQTCSHKNAAILFLIFLCRLTFAQTGPGGVDNSTNNVLWLKANAGTSTTTNSVAVSSWIDQSGNANNVAQPTANLQPLYMTNIINGYPCILFDNNSGTNDKLQGKNSTTLDGTRGYTFFMVSRQQVLDGAARTIISKRQTVGVNESFMQFYQTSNEINTDIDGNGDRYTTTAAASFSINTNYIIDQLYDGTLAQASRCKTYIGGTLNVTSSETSTIVPNYNSPLLIGSTDTSDGRPLGGYIAELIVYRRALNNAERYIVDNYLSSKYNITIANDLYAGDNVGNGSYYMDVAGIGTDATGSNTAFATTRSAGLGITQNSGFGNGDYIMVGHKTVTNGLDSSDIGGIAGGTFTARWSRIWYWDIRDAAPSLTANISFDLVAGGFSPSPNAGTAANYKLIYRSGQSGSWTMVATASSVSGTTISFANISLAATGDGYYGLASLNYPVSPLPIELLSFNAIANNNKVDLKWETVTEINNAYFTIEKSKDGQTFEKVIDVPGAGNSTSLKEYYESDYQPYTGTSYYRLKQTDRNGNYTYFPLSIVKYNANMDMEFYPNPISAKEDLNIKVSGYQNKEVLVVLRDISGREYFSKVLVIQEETGLFAIDATQQIPPGTYIIVASSNGDIYSRKIIVN